MLRIDFVSDIACPWCAVGLNALELALESLGGEVQAELHFQPFELNPDMGAEGADAAAYLKAKYGIDDVRLAHNRRVIQERGTAVGFVFGERRHVWNTFDAHRLLHWAGTVGLAPQRALKHALLQAYHGDGRNPSDPAVLLALAQAVGLDHDAAAGVLAGEAFADAVRSAERQWLRSGIQAVPAVVVNGRHLIQGGQPPEQYVQALRRIAREAA